MSDCKLVFFDIDGTIWDFNNIIPESTKRAISLLKERGHKTFINTGRARGYVRNESLLALGFDGIVSGCGTMIEYEGKEVFKTILDPKLVADSIDIVKNYGFRSILEGTDTLYLDYKEWVDDIYFKKLYRDLGDDIKDYHENWGKWDTICKFSCDTTGGDMEGGLKALSDKFSFAVHNSYVVEVIPKGFNKSYGIKFMCDYLGIDRKDTFAFGDSNNDADMISYAGCGVVMGNGQDSLKEIADYITDPLKEDGIFNALRHFGLI